MWRTVRPDPGRSPKKHVVVLGVVRRVFRVVVRVPVSRVRRPLFWILVELPCPIRGPDRVDDRCAVRTAILAMRNVVVLADVAKLLLGDLSRFERDSGGCWRWLMTVPLASANAGHAIADLSLANLAALEDHGALVSHTASRALGRHLTD